MAFYEANVLRVEFVDADSSRSVIFSENNPPSVLNACMKSRGDECIYVNGLVNLPFVSCRRSCVLRRCGANENVWLPLIDEEVLCALCDYLNLGCAQVRESYEKKFVLWCEKLGVRGFVSIRC